MKESYRVDYQKFVSSVKSGKNMFVHAQGGMSNRAGTLMLGKAKTADSSVVEENVMLFCWNISAYPLYYTESATPKEGDVVYKDLETTPSCKVVSVDLTTNPNAIVIKDGAYNRNSVRYSGFDTERVVTKTKNFTKKVRLIPFEFSNTETYMIEFGDFYCRFYTTNGQVVNEDGTPYEIVSPFTTNDLDKIRYVQSGDVMYLAWGGKPKTLTRYGHTNWKFDDYEYKNGPFELENYDENKHLSLLYDVDNLKYIVSSDFYNFSLKDVGRLFYINKTFQAVHISKKVASSLGEYNSEVSITSGNYEFHTKGTWTGVVKIEYSKDKVNWKSEREFSGYDNINFDFTGSFEEGIWWVRISSKITSGELIFTFDTQSTVEKLVFSIVGYISEKRCYAEYKGQIKGVDSVFVNKNSSNIDDGSIVEIIPKMTSNTTPYGEMYSATYGDNAWKLTLGMLDTVPGISKGTGGSFGYKPKKACYVNKIKFLPLAGRDFVPLQGDFNNMFSDFKVNYSISSGSNKQIGYSIEREEIPNSLGLSYFILNLNETVLLDDLFIMFTVSNNLPGSQGKLYIQEFSATGIYYVPGEEDNDTLSELTSSFAFGSWHEEKKYPTEVELYQDRIEWFTNNHLDATKISDYNNFGVSTDVTDDDAISVIIKDKKINKINTAIAGNKLVVFTDSGNFIHNNDTFTPNSRTFLKQGSTGGANVKPVIVRDNIIYVHPMKQAISDYAYNFETDGYAGQDITILANHLFENKKIKELAYQQEPYSIIWVLQEEGTVLACTYLRQQQVIAWTPMDFGGKVISIGVLSDGSNQELYLAVQRKNGTFVEKMPTRLPVADPKDRFFVDCGRTYRGEPATVITGLEYLNGETVVALADGYVVKDLVVTNGQITLPNAASVVTVGLPYESVFETLTFDVNNGDGSNLNRKKRVVAVSVRYYNSRGSKISVNGHREVNMLERKTSNDDTDISLRNGFYREILPSSHDEPTTVKIRQDEPLPITIVSVIPELEYER